MRHRRRFPRALSIIPYEKSGIGREYGDFGIEAFLEPKSLLGLYTADTPHRQQTGDPPSRRRRDAGVRPVAWPY
jgi:hypothetical protein